jgi:Ca2+-binding RTX toxin-like protein
LTATNANAGTTFNIQNTAGTLAISAVNATTPTTSDAFTVNLAGGVTLSTLSGGNDVVDILNINSNGTAANIISTLTLTTGGTLAATINAGGTQALTITNALPNLGTGAFNGANALGKITVTANSSDNAAITGGSAGDVLTGDAGLDTISGGAGNDTINGGAAADLITGGTGADSITGGTGINTFVFAPGDSGSTSTTRDIITDLKTSDVIKFSGYGVTALTNATNIGTSAASSTTKEIYVSAVNSTNAKIVIETSADGSTFEEIYIPASYANASFVYSTNSTVDISDDFITVGTAPLAKTNDGLGTLTLTGNTIAAVTVAINDSASPQVGGETVAGGIVRTLVASNVTSNGVIVTGSAGNDTITASPQADTIRGGAGADSITAGLGADTITVDARLTSVSGEVLTGRTFAGADIITGFVSGTDKIDIGGIALNTVAAGGAINTAIGTADDLGGTTGARFVADTLGNLVTVSANAYVIEVTTAIAGNFTTQAGIDAAMTAGQLIGAGGFGSTASGANANTILVIAYDNQATANAALFTYTANGVTGTDVAAADFQLVGVLTAVGTGALAAGDFI